MFCIQNTMRLDEAGVLIRQARRQAGLTQAELAARRGMSRSTISQIENGVIAEIGLRKFVGLCAELGLSLELAPISRPTLDKALPKARADAFNAAVRTDQAILDHAKTRH